MTLQSLRLVYVNCYCSATQCLFSFVVWSCTHPSSSLSLGTCRRKLHCVNLTQVPRLDPLSKRQRISCSPSSRVISTSPRRMSSSRRLHLRTWNPLWKSTTALSKVKCRRQDSYKWTQLSHNGRPSCCRYLYRLHALPGCVAYGWCGLRWREVSQDCQGCCRGLELSACGKIPCREWTQNSQGRSFGIMPEEYHK